MRGDQPYAEIAAQAAQIRERLCALAAEQPCWTPIVAAYRALGRDLGIADPEVAVRSSATGEDGQANSFAGLHSTSLSIRGEKTLIAAVKQTWASLFSAEAIVYRLQNNLEMCPQMAVVVQQLVKARASGVMMTLNPLNGDRSKMVIEATWGLGALLVANQITPDRFLTDKITGEVIKREVAAKMIAQLPDQNREQGPQIVDVPRAQQRKPSLSTVEIAALISAGKKIEEALGAAQDIEFALEQDQIFYLQTRPETVWNRRPRITFGLPPEPIAQIVSMVLRGGKQDEKENI